MNTVVVPTEPKKVVSVEILHLDELGYGPQGKHTRREWRAECLKNLLAGKEQFEAWQAGWKALIKIKANYPIVSLTTKLMYEDGTEETILRNDYLVSARYALDFVAHKFELDVNATSFIFEHAAYFNCATFTGLSNFQSATFTEFSNFSYAMFSGNANLSGAAFGRDANFSSVTFKRDANFSSVMFKQDANFSSVTFGQGANFFCTTFTWKATFNNAKFTGQAFFSSAKFTGYANFSTTTFSWVAYFRNTTFTAHAIFNNATFTGNAIFNNAAFAKDAEFIKVKFINQCRFDNVLNTKGKPKRKETTFDGVVNFENTEISNVGHFERVQFNGEIPNFLGVDNSKTLLIFSDDTYFNKLDTTEDAIKRIAQLKRLADEQGQTDQALMFNSFELNAKRAQAREKTEHLTRWQKINNGDYWFANATAAFRIFSDYGCSFFEPLKWYLALLSITFYLAIAHAVYFTNKECPDEYANIFSYLWRDQIQCAPVKPKDNETPIVLSGWRAAVEYTSYRASGILDFADSDKQTIAISNRLFNQPIEPPWMRAWGIFKGIASIALLFLAALGLRNKYRIK